MPTTGSINILKRLLRFKGIPIHGSGSFHRDILDLSVESGLISLELSKRFDEFRAFRHFFVHGYGIMLDGERLLPLAQSLPEVWEGFESELDRFLGSARGK
jgi:uncharacterized protein YutE (UPF0331/DUF86 family)